MESSMSEAFIPKTVEIIIKGEKVIVKDPSVKKVLLMIRDAKSVLIKLTGLAGSEGMDSLGNLTDLLADPEVFKAFCSCASACTDKSLEFYHEGDGISLGEAGELLEAMRTAVNWEVLKELFRKMIPSMGLSPTNSPNLVVG